MSKKVMKLIDPRTGHMECKVCGDYHIANIKPGSNGHYYRGSWQCRHGCKLETTEKPILQKKIENPGQSENYKSV